MTLVKIWRLERNGRGAYNDSLMHETRWEGENRLKHKCDPWSHPDPRQVGEDGSELAKFWRENDKARSAYFFGFRSKKQFLQWCNCKWFRTDLNTMGGELICYEVERHYVVYGHRQVIFKKDQAKIINRIPVII